MSDGAGSGYEADLESNSEWEGENVVFGEYVDTSTGHRQQILLTVENLPIGEQLDREGDFTTKCEECSTTWRWKFELFRESNGWVSYDVASKRTDHGKKEVNGEVWVELHDGTNENGVLHQKKFAENGMVEGFEVDGSYRGAMTAAQVQNLPERKFVFQMYLVVELCHRNRKRKYESDSSNGSPPNNRH